MKDKRLQVRLTEDDHIFLHEYADRNGLSISQMIRDFIEWLKRREKNNGSEASS
jgi:hypothetical protein